MLRGREDLRRPRESLRRLPPKNERIPAAGRQELRLDDYLTGRRCGTRAAKTSHMAVARAHRNTSRPRQKIHGPEPQRPGRIDCMHATARRKSSRCSSICRKRSSNPAEGITRGRSWRGTHLQQAQPCFSAITMMVSFERFRGVKAPSELPRSARLPARKRRHRQFRVSVPPPARRGGTRFKRPGRTAWMRWPPRHGA